MCWEPEAWLTPPLKHGSDALALPSLLPAPPCDHSCPLSSQDVAEGWSQARVRQEIQNTAEAGLTCGWQQHGMSCKQLCRVCISAGKFLSHSFLIQIQSLSRHGGIELFEGSPVCCWLRPRYLEWGACSWLSFSDVTAQRSGSWWEAEPPCEAECGRRYL